MYNPHLDRRRAYAVPTGDELGLGDIVEATENEYVISLGDLLRVIWKRLWIILLTALVLTGATVGFSLLQTPLYEASIKILVGQEQGSSTSSNLGGDVQGLQQLAQTMVEGVDSRPVAKAVIQQHELQVTSEDFLENYLSVQQIGDTQFIEVTYKDPSPEKAQQVANTVGGVFSEQVSEVSQNANDITATVWELAEMPDRPVSPDFVLNIGLALVIGLMLGVGLAFLLEYLDDSWRSPEEAEQISGIPTFGVIPEFKSLEGKKGR